MLVTEKLKQRFEAKVNRTDTCHFWHGASRGVGYGCIKVDGKVLDSHRVAYELYVGEIPDGMLVMHTCDNRNCVNPAHLKVGTYKQNAQDAAERGMVGARNRKLTYSQAEHIRQIYKLGDTTIAKLAEQYGLGDETIRKIVAGLSYNNPTIERMPAAREPLTETELATLRSDYAGGVSKKQLCRKYNIAPTTIHRLLKAA